MVYSIKRTGPKMEPWGTPEDFSSIRQSMFQVLVLEYCSRILYFIAFFSIRDNSDFIMCSSHSFFMFYKTLMIAFVIKALRENIFTWIQILATSTCVFSLQRVLSLVLVQGFFFTLNPLI